MWPYTKKLDFQIKNLKIVLILILIFIWERTRQKDENYQLHLGICPDFS